MCLTTSSIAHRLLNKIEQYNRLIWTNASELWHELYNRASSTRLACIHLVCNFILNRVDLTLHNQAILHLLFPKIEVRVIELSETHVWRVGCGSHFFDKSRLVESLYWGDYHQEKGYNQLVYSKYDRAELMDMEQTNKKKTKTNCKINVNKGVREREN